MPNIHLDGFDFTRWDAVLYTAIIWILLFVLKSILLSFLHHRISDAMSFYRTKRVVNGISFFIFTLFLMIIWVETGSNFLTFFGLFSAGLALALKDILLNIAGWLYILIRQPFYVGDRIEIAGIKGDVIDQNLFKFRVIEIGNWVHAEQSTGRIIHIPNYKIFTDAMANYSIGFEYIWDEIRVLVTFESDWRRAKDILWEVIRDISDDLVEEVRKEIKETSKKYMVYYNNLTPIVYTEVVDSGVQLTMRYICKPKMRRVNNERIWEAVLERFEKEAHVEIAYPTMRRV